MFFVYCYQFLYSISKHSACSINSLHKIVLVFHYRMSEVLAYAKRLGFWFILFTKQSSEIQIFLCTLMSSLGTLDDVIVVYRRIKNSS